MGAGCQKDMLGKQAYLRIAFFDACCLPWLTSWLVTHHCNEVVCARRVPVTVVHLAEDAIEDTIVPGFLPPFVKQQLDLFEARRFPKGVIQSICEATQLDVERINLIPMMV